MVLKEGLKWVTSYVEMAIGLQRVTICKLDTYY